MQVMVHDRTPTMVCSVFPLFHAWQTISKTITNKTATLSMFLEKSTKCFHGGLLINLHRFYFSEKFFPRTFWPQNGQETGFSSLKGFKPFNWRFFVAWWLIKILKMLSDSESQVYSDGFTKKISDLKNVQNLTFKMSKNNLFQRKEILTF